MGGRQLRAGRSRERLMTADPADELTQSESKWLDALEKLLKRQPKNLRILVHPSHLSAVRPDEVQAYFDEHGDVDNVPDLRFIEHDGKFQPCSESM